MTCGPKPGRSFSRRRSHDTLSTQWEQATGERTRPEKGWAFIEDCIPSARARFCLGLRLTASRASEVSRLDGDPYSLLSNVSRRISPGSPPRVTMSHDDPQNEYTYKGLSPTPFLSLLTQDLIVDQTIEKVSFCAPDQSNDKAFSYICRDGTTRRWMCHSFLAVRD